MARVLLIGPRPGARGGIAQFTAHLHSSLAGAAEVRWLAFSRLYPARSAAGRTESLTDPEGGPEADPVLVAWRPWTWRSAARRIRALSPDLVVIQWWHPFFGPALRSVARASRRAGARVAFVCHNAEPHERFPFGRALTRRTLREAEVLFALSKSTAETLRTMGADADISVMPHPAYAFPASDEGRALWRRRLPTGRPVIAFFGYVRPYKGLEDLIAAMPAVLDVHPGAVLAVAGPFLEPKARYRELAERAGVGASVRLFPGYVPDAEVGGLLAESDVVVLPYRSASQSGVLPLALAAGVPAVVTDVGGLAEDLGGRGVVVPAAEPKALAGGIIQALTMPRLPRSGHGERDGWTAWSRAILEAAGAPATQRVPAQSVGWKAAKLAGAAIVAFFMVRVLADALAALRADAISFAWWPVLASTALGLIANVLDVAGWHRLMAAAGVRVRPARGARIYTSAGLIRFVPGGVLHLFARWKVAQRHGASPEGALGITVLDLGLRVAGGAALFVATLGAVLHLGAFGLVPVVAVAVAAPFMLRPKVIGWGARSFRRLLRHRGGPDIEAATPLVARAAGWYAAAWLARGLGFALLCAAVAPVQGTEAWAVAGGFAAAWVVGVAVPIAPGGIGVREAVGTALLAPILGAPLAAVVMLASRVQSLVLEAAVAGGAALWDRLDVPAAVEHGAARA